MADDRSFLRRYAKTRRFTLGQPRDIKIAQDGRRISFLRSVAGDDPMTALWMLDLDSLEERVVCDPRDLPAAAGDLPPEERARRERAREGAAGIVAYALDEGVRWAALALNGELFTADLEGGEVRHRDAAGPVVDPRPDPTGQRVAYVTGGALRVLGPGHDDVVLAEEDDPDVTWGLAEFVAAEEMDRARGYWWAPDGTAILAARVDNGPVMRWHIADPSDPAAPATVVHYPAAGTANADVTLSVLGLNGDSIGVNWDRESFPYLARVLWKEGHPPTLLVQSRDQRTTQVLTVDPSGGGVTLVREGRDPVWLDLVIGTPDWLDDGRLVMTADDQDTRRLVFGDEFVTPPGLQVRSVVHTGRSVVVSASDEPTEVQILRVGADGEVEALAVEPGVHVGVATDDVAVVTSSRIDESGSETVVLRGTEPVATIRSVAELPEVEPRPVVRSLGPRALRGVVLFPTSGADRSAKLPVLLDPYGGPHFQRVLAARPPYLLSQWFADQGFAVLVVDGRGTPARGHDWDRSIHRNFGIALDDQIDALHAAAEEDPRLDLSRVAIRGWSFGGELAAMAALRRPDVFHAAVAGAPVTDQRLYDTHYTERYLGDPDEDPETYRRNSLIEDAPNLQRPLLLIHGLADDNVVVAHTLRLSRALLESGRPHSVLALSGITHMTPQEVVTENLIRLELAFLRQALGLGPGG